MMNEHVETPKGMDFVIKVVGPGIDVSQKVDGPTALNTLQMLWGPADLPPAVPVGHQRARRSEGKVAVGEFLSGLHATNNPEKIAGIALYVRDHLGQDRVQKAEILDWFATAGEPAPRNLTRDLQNAITKRLIAEDHAKRGYYYVTQTGLDLIQEAANASATTRAADVPAARRTRGNRARGTNSSSSLIKGRARATGSSDGPMGQLVKLKADGFFKEPKTMQNILAELETRGIHYIDSYLTNPLQTLVRRQELRRKKRVPEGGKKEVWHYSNWS